MGECLSPQVGIKVGTGWSDERRLDILELTVRRR